MSHLNACNKQVTSKQQTRFSLTSINLSSKTTVVFGAATTILEIGVSFPTVDCIYTGSIPTQESLR
jgi:late competence protein required for DNA uptake (superfamily II DNA/RNA helicase)